MAAITENLEPLVGVFSTAPLTQLGNKRPTLL
jgi:hypothetical protein